MNIDNRIDVQKRLDKAQKCTRCKPHGGNCGNVGRRPKSDKHKAKR